MISGSTYNQGAEDAGTLRERKRELRARFRALREGMDVDEARAASQALCQGLADWAVVRGAHSVLAYIAFRNELDLRPLFELLPQVHWLVPRVDDRELVLHPYDPSQLVRHRFGMLEPAAELPVICPVTVDIVLAPGVAFDRHGGRLGFGGGFYDRFLPTSPALRVGITYDRCLVDVLPLDEHDQRVDWVVTPTQRIHCTPP
jgi:5-formyltetrahydrofolate cyclo-ligase